MEKEYNENSFDWNALEGDFYGFLEEKNWDAANVIIDNLAELNEFEKGLELCMKRCAAIMKDCMTVPADYGEKGCCEMCADSHPAVMGGKWRCINRYCSKCHKEKFAEQDNPLNGVKVVESQMDTITKGLIF